MTMEYIRTTYNVPAKRGMHVKVYERGRLTGQWHVICEGSITRATNMIHVNGRTFHPTDGVVYYDDEGRTLCDTRALGGGAGLDHQRRDPTA